MRRAGWLAGLALCLGGCAAAVQERVQTFNDDGVYLYQRGNYAAARDSFQSALTLKPEDSSLLFNLGQCYDQLGDTARAEQSYQECLQRAPDQKACMHALIALKVRTGRQTEARQVVNEWMIRSPKQATPYAEDGWLYHQAGDLPRAQARLQQALELDPHDNRALTELALVYEAMQRPDRALVLYERALTQDPNQPDVVNRVNFLLTKGAGPPRPDE